MKGLRLSGSFNGNAVLGFLFFLVVDLTRRCQGGEFTFELHDRDKQCFYQVIEKGVTCTLEYQVIINHFIVFLCVYIT